MVGLCRWESDTAPRARAVSRSQLRSQISQQRLTHLIMCARGTKMLCLRRIIERFRAGVGGPLPSRAAFRDRPWTTGVDPTFELCQRLVDRLGRAESDSLAKWRSWMIIIAITAVKADNVSSPGWFGLLQVVQFQTEAFRHFRKLHFASLLARSSKRQGPLVLGLTGGDA